MSFATGLLSKGAIDAVHETNEDLTGLQRLLDESYATAGEHLRSSFTPQHRAHAADLTAVLMGVFLINLATVTARCSLPPDSKRARGWYACSSFAPPSPIRPS